MMNMPIRRRTKNQLWGTEPLQIVDDDKFRLMDAFISVFLYVSRPSLLRYISFYSFIDKQLYFDPDPDIRTKFNFVIFLMGNKEQDEVSERKNLVQPCHCFTQQVP